MLMSFLLWSLGDESLNTVAGLLVVIFGGAFARCGVLTDDLALEPATNECDDEIAVLFEDEVPGVEQMKLCIREVIEVRERSGEWEDLVVTTPGDDRRGLILAEVRLPLRVQRKIAPVVVRELELHRDIARPIEQRLHNKPVVRADRIGDARAVCELPLGCFECQQAAEVFDRLLVVRVLPELTPRPPECVGQPFLVCVAVLDDEPGDTVWVFGREAKPDGGTVVLM